ncbi:MAG: response regulator transcription factor [Planctomycetes bacterium]|nr:response regulator transcription factor [Planctomycetota bacterium]
MSQEATVYVVDDDPAVRDSVSALVNSAGLRAQTFPSAEAFLADYKPEQPGCLVTDLRMLGMSGLDLLETLAKSESPLPAILISAYADVPVAVRAIEKGAVTVLEKPCRNDQLVQAIHKALERNAVQRTEQDIKARLATLTPEEYEVMQRMVAGKLNKVIASELLISLRTVETRRHNAMEKMKAESLAELVAFVLKVHPELCPTPIVESGITDDEKNAN